MSSNEQIILLRTLERKDFPQLREVIKKAYPNWTGTAWHDRYLNILMDKFPEGQLCIEVNGVVVGAAFSLIVDYSKFGDNHTYTEITDNDNFTTHDPTGDVLYGIDIFIHPEYRGLRLGRRLYDARKELCESLNLRSIIAGGRLPGYSEHADTLTPQAYIESVRKREIYDSTLSFQLANDFHVKRFILNYLKGDEDSKGYATLLEWSNIYYESEESLINVTKSEVRLGLVQWQMRLVNSFEQFKEQVDFFIDVVSDYNCDFILFPEFFNAPLMAPYNDLPQAEAVRKLAAYTPELLTYFKELAVSYNVNIITGSMPFMENIDNPSDPLLNVGFLCRRDGTHEQFSKIHITPSEAYSFGMVGGNRVQAFDTDAGRIGVLICYDSEFPELSRLLADDGMQILFVPFMTDTQNGYNRVRHCSQARAIENECYVAIAGSVGNLPRVHNMDIQYAQSAVFSPCDFAFPTNGVVTEATANAEMTLIADVNLDLLKDLHHNGSVHNLRDRRTDLFELRWKPDGESARKGSGR